MKACQVQRCFLLSVALVASLRLVAEVDPVFKDGVTLPAGEPIVVWGRCSPGKNVRVSFRTDVKESVKADGDGCWRAVLEPSPVSSVGLDLVITEDGAGKTGRTVTVIRDVKVSKSSPDVLRVPNREDVTLADDVQIYLGERPSPVVRYAAEVLRDNLARVAGIRARVAVDGERPSIARTVISLGDNAFARASGIRLDGVPRDGYRLATAANRVYILGRDDPSADPAVVPASGAANFERGTLNGVYGFLEDFVGVRFYFPGELGTAFRKKEAIVVPSRNEIVAPVFSDRNLALTGGVFEPEMFQDGEDPKKDVNAVAFRQYLTYRLESRMTRGNHMGEGIVANMGKSHPEVHGMEFNRARNASSPRNWGVCYSCGKTWDRFYEETVAKWSSPDSVPDTRALGADFVDVVPVHGLRPCQCPDCRAHYNDDALPAGNGASEVIWGGTAKLAVRLAQAGFRTQRVRAMAYRPYSRVPVGVEIPDNVDVTLCNSGPWQKASPKLVEILDGYLDAWYEKLGRRKLALFSQSGKFGCYAAPDIPCQTPRAVAEYYAARTDRISGAALQLSADRWIYNYLNRYVFAHIGWKPKLDVEALLAEHDNLMFGAAAPEMAEIERTIEDKWIGGMVRYKVTDRLEYGPEGKATDGHWKDVYTPEVRERMGAVFSAAEGKLSAGSLELRRVKFFRELYLERMNRRAAGGDASKKES